MSLQFHDEVDEIVRVYRVIRKLDHVFLTFSNDVDKDLVVWPVGDHFATAVGWLLASKHVEVSALTMHAVRVVLRHAWIHVGAVGVVEYHSRRRVVSAVDDVVEHEDHDALVRDAMTVERLARMAHACLTTVVVPAG